MKKHIRIFTFIIMGLCFPAVVFAINCPILTTIYVYKTDPGNRDADGTIWLQSKAHDGGPPKCSINLSKDQLCAVVKKYITLGGVIAPSNIQLWKVVWGADPVAGRMITGIRSYRRYKCPL